MAVWQLRVKKDGYKDIIFTDVAKGQYHEVGEAEPDYPVSSMRAYIATHAHAGDIILMDGRTWVMMPGVGVDFNDGAPQFSGLRA